MEYTKEKPHSIIKTTKELFIMRMEKYKQKGLGNLLAHYERKDYENRNFQNENIDKSKTALNYNLAPVHQNGQYKFVKDRCEELNVLKRADVTWCVSWCLTCPQEIKDDAKKCEAFFKAAYEFLADRYGLANVISCYVHMDEVSPHLHFAFCPVSKTLKTEFDKETAEIKTRLIEKVSCKEVITKAELSTIHKEMQEHLNQTLDFEVSVLNGATEHGNKSVKELKQIERLKEQNQMLEEKQKHLLHNLKVLIKNAYDLEVKSKKIKELVQNLFETSNVQISELQRKVEILDNKYYDIKVSFKGFEEFMNDTKKLEKTFKELELQHCEDLEF